MDISDNSDDMTVIEDFLHPLHEGIWEVTIPRNLVSEPLGSGWVRSRINIPTPGTIDSYRCGQYHLHETSTEFKVHLDRYDPVTHPVLHLIDDAPLLLMISETFITLISLSRRSVLTNIPKQLEQQVATFRHHLILGVLIFILGAGFFLAPDLTFWSITRLVIPAGVFLAGLLILMGGITLKPPGVVDQDDIVRGISIIGVSVILSIIPPILWGSCVLVIIAGWMFASAFILLKRILHGKKAVPEGFMSRLCIGVTSLILGMCSFLAPVPMFHLFENILGLLTMIFGGVILLIGIRLRNLMQRTQNRTPNR